MEIDYSKLAFISTLKYMRIFKDYTLPSGGGTINHDLNYIPYFFVFALVQDTLIALQSGNVEFPGGDFPNYVISATITTITVTENVAPANPATYFIRVYEDPLP